MMDAPHTLAWLAEILGWACVRETAAGLVVSRASPRGEPASLVVTAAELAGVPPATMRSWLEGTEVVRTTPSGRRVMGARGPEGWVVCVDAQRESLVRRAESVDLAASVAHEVASTLAAIAGWAQVLRAGGADDPQAVLRLIGDAARATSQTARDLLGEVGHAGVEGQVDVAVVAKDVLRLLRPQAQEAQITLDLDVNGPAQAAFSRAAAFRVLWNLALNGIQHARTVVRVSVRRRGATITVEVRDDGEGMPPETAAHVFESYYTEREGGTGLGLALVQRTVEAAGGTIGVETDVGAGACFGFTVPRADKRKKEMSGVVARTQLPARVLVVEDDTALRELLCTTLELRGVEVVGAASAAEVRALKTPVDVAVVDYRLEDARGDAVFSLLRDRALAHRILGMSGAERPALEEPPDAWLRKPFEPSDLLEAIRAVSTEGAPPNAGAL